MATAKKKKTTAKVVAKKKPKPKPKPPLKGKFKVGDVCKLTKWVKGNPPGELVGVLALVSDGQMINYEIAVLHGANADQVLRVREHTLK